MSWYFNYYVGYKDKDGKIYPLGPYDADGNLHPVYWRNKNSKIYKDFYNIPVDSISDALEDEWHAIFEDGDYSPYIQYLPVSELPKDDYIKTGYFLREDIEAYLDEEGYFEGFWSNLDPVVYAELLRAEVAKGSPMEPKYDIEGGEMPQHSAFDYSYFAYPDYESKEYEAHMLRLACSSLDDFTYKSDNDKELVIILTQG